MVDRECLPDEYHLVQQIMTYLHWALEHTLEVSNIFGTRAVSVAIFPILLLLNPMLWLISELRFCLSNNHRQSSKCVRTFYPSFL